MAAKKDPDNDNDNEATEPYGDVEYADPGYQADKKKRYPIDTPEHVHSAWSYINQRSNASKYNASQLRSIISKIRGAARKFKITLTASAP